MVWLGALLGQLPSLVISVAACIVAMVLIKGPGRWLALGGVVTWIVSSLVSLGFAIPDDTVRQVLVVVNLVLGLVGYGLLAAAVIVGQRWAQRQQPPVTMR